MAKEQYSDKSKVRIVVFEMEGGDKAISESLATIATALTRPQAPQRAVIITSPTLEGKSISESTQGALFIDSDDEVEPSLEQTKTPKTRKVYSPKVLELDLDGGEKPWRQYAADKNPSSHNSRFLVCLQWLKDSLQVEGATDDHVFTLYKAAKWPTDIPDFSSPFRALIKSQEISRPGRGLYAINHIGSHKVGELGAS